MQLTAGCDVPLSAAALSLHVYVGGVGPHRCKHRVEPVPADHGCRGFDISSSQVSQEDATLDLTSTSNWEYA